MADKAQGRWVYIAGIAVLVVLVVVAIVFGRSGGQDGDAGEADAAADAAADDAVADGGGDAAADSALAVTTTPHLSEAGPAIPPEDETECQAYCRRLDERGELGEGVTVARCIAELCSDEEGSGGDGGAGRIPTVSAPAVEALPDDCEAQCRALHSAGELRPGMSVAECVAAMCSEEEAEEE